MAVTLAIFFSLLLALQITGLIINLRRPPTKHWRLLYLVEFLSITAALSVMIYYGRIWGKQMISSSEYWDKYLICYCAVCVYCVVVLITTFAKAVTLQKSVQASSSNTFYDKKNLHPCVQIMFGIACGLISFAISYLFMKAFFTRPLEDYLVAVFKVMLPVITVILLTDTIGRFHPLYILIGLLVQYAILIFCAGSVSKYLGYTTSGPFGGFDYIGSEFAWPLFVTFLQFIILYCVSKIKPIKRTAN